MQGCALKPNGRWQDNAGAHYRWCLNASDAQRAGEQRARSDWLWACGAVGDRRENARCDAYAYRTVDHFRLTRKTGCGVRVDGRWNANYDTHYEWCLDAGEPARGREQDARDGWLFRCGDQHMID